MNNTFQIFERNGGKFLIPSDLFIDRCKKIKAIIWDWDGVFNSGIKDEKGSSPFNEVDSMGTNLLRFSMFLKSGKLPYSAVISGEKNESAFFWGKRECLHASYFKIKHKIEAIEHICSNFAIQKEEIAFVFDDVLDLSAAKEVGLRMFIPRISNPLFNQFVEENNLADYICYSYSGENAVRESSEVMIAGIGNFKQVIHERMDYGTSYQNYIQERNKTEIQYFTFSENGIIKTNKP
jgi:3-deoxy-D-manno-octulosonate 8-phosphate phosphatase (KDO 8-P phosphatase)